MRSLTRATAVMTIGTVLSRTTGLFRLMALAAALGVAETRLTDTYNLANTAPNIIYELVLGGILTSVFVPVFVELLEKEGRERAWAVGSAIINVSVVVLAVVAAVGVIAAPWIASIYSVRIEGPEAELQHEALTFLLRLFIPQIVFYGLAAVTGGLLQAHQRFAAPMFTPILNNVTVIAVLLVFAASYGAVTLAEVTTQQLLILGLGTTAGVAVMAAAQLPYMRGLGTYRATLSVAHPSIKKVARLSVFVIGYVVANQIGYLIIQFLANRQQGGYSAYIAAFTFFLLPHGLFAVSIITALLPGMSEHAANRRWPEFRDRMSTGVRTSILLLLPAAVGYFVLAEPIVRFLLERGVMTGASTELVAGVLQFFVVGLVPFSLFQLLSRGFYALQDTKTPFLVNCAAVALNTAINIPMFSLLEVRGLAAGHAAAYIFGSALLARALSRRIGGVDAARIGSSFARIAAASAGMGAVVWGLSAAVRRAVDVHSFLGGALEVGVPVAGGVVSFLGLAVLLRVQELSYLRSLLTRRGRAA